MNSDTTLSFVRNAWQQDVLPALRDVIRIPALSPGFDAGWEAHGHLEAAVQLARDWVAARNLRGARIDVLRLPGRTPVLLVEVDGTAPGNILLYGHLDKQPPFEGWREGLGPWTPVEENGRLYGRGAADDGYAVFAAVTAIQALQQQDAPHPRLVLLIEASEESGSPDLPEYMVAAAERIGAPDLVVGLDSGCGDYLRLWDTTSLRGVIIATLRIDVLGEGVHSGAASGIVPSSFRIARRLLDRIDDSRTGDVLPKELHVEIPRERLADARRAAEVLGPQAFELMPFVPGMRAMDRDITTLLLNRTWRPALSIIGQEGLPQLADGGNVLRPFTTLKLSLRVPPTTDVHDAGQALKRILEADVPYGARATCTIENVAQGWAAPVTKPWLWEAVEASSRAYFGQGPCAMGEGGSIPFMAMLGTRFPKAQFLITGVLGPGSNAHGPNEFIDIEYATKLTACVAEVITRAVR